MIELLLAMAVRIHILGDIFCFGYTVHRLTNLVDQCIHIIHSDFDFSILFPYSFFMLVQNICIAQHEHNTIQLTALQAIANEGHMQFDKP